MIDTKELDRLKAKIQSINAGLECCSIRLNRSNLCLRATLPSKTGGDKKQRDIYLGLTLTPTGLLVAKAKAKELDSQLLLDKFDWDNWNKNQENKSTEVTSLKKEKTAEAWIAEFETSYWDRNQKTLSRAANFKEDYLKPFNDIPLDKVLTEALLTKIILTHSLPDSRKRQRYCMALQALAKFSGLDCKFNQYKGRYVPPLREIPSDGDIEKLIDAVSNPNWQRVSAMLATYGIRPHEIFHLDTSRMSEKGLLIVTSNTKTGSRSVLPCLPEWVSKWDLTNVRFPAFTATPEKYANKDLGGKLGNYFKNYGITFEPYTFRDAYAIRLSIYGFSDSIASKMMGHSLHVHYNSYQKHLDERSIVAAFDKVFE
jgi:hypothetical protein